MNQTFTLSAHDLQIAEQAAEWVGTLDQAGPEQQAAFIAWLKQSSRHVEEFLLAASVYRELDGVDAGRNLDIAALLAEGASNVVSLPAAGETPPNAVQTKTPVVKKRTRLNLSLAAGVAALALGAVFYQLQASRYSTAVGEQRVVQLPDGSVMHLNTHSAVRMDFSRQARELRLVSGEALFSVAPDATRPFRVFTSDAAIQALGTQFNVYQRAQGTTVAVIEGKVAVSARDADPAASNKQTLTAGQEARVSATGAVKKLAQTDTATTIAWRQRRLVFKEDRLGDVAAEFNRYNRGLRIHVTDPVAAERRLTAVFDADAPESLLRFLSDAADIQVSRDGGQVEISAR